MSKAQYTTIRSNNDIQAEFESRVTAMINIGWIPLGGMSEKYSNGSGLKFSKPYSQTLYRPNNDVSHVIIVLTVFVVSTLVSLFLLK